MSYCLFPTFIFFHHFSPVKVEKDKTVAEDDICQGSESKLDVCRESNTPGADSDHDYTVIGSSSPTHTEDRLVTRFLFCLH